MNSLDYYKKDIQTERVVTLTSLGTLIHWYDFYVLAFMLPFIFENQIRFGRLSGTTLSLIAFLIGFLIRPIGAFYFGAQIDRYGRRNYFTVSLYITATATLIAALFPFSALPPFISLIVLLFCRTLHGLALSIEYGSAVCYITEFVPKTKNGYFTSVIQSTAILGMLFALITPFALQQIITPSAYSDWGWRIPLLFGLPLIFISRKIRISLPESPAFEDIKRRQQQLLHPVKKIFQNAPLLKKVVVSLFAVSIPQAVVYYLAHFYLILLLNPENHLLSGSGNFIMITCMLLTWPMTLLAGRLSDQIQTHKFFLFIVTLACLLLPLIFKKIESSSQIQPPVEPWGLALYIIPLFTLAYLIHGSAAALLTQMFPTPLRGSAVSISYHLGNGFFGGLIPVIGELTLKNECPTNIPIYFGLTFLIIGILTLFFQEKILNENYLD